MATTQITALTPDSVISFEINPGMLGQFLEARTEGGPRLKCFEGSVTLVSPGRSHETTGRRLVHLITAICEELEIEHTELASTLWAVPPGKGDTAYEPDESYYIQSHETATEGQVPDLAIEIVVSNPEKKAIRCGVALGIPEMWVFDVPRRRLTFYRLSRRGKNQGTYQPRSKSLAFPFLFASEVLEQLDDRAQGSLAFRRSCQEWARRVLVPRQN